MRCFVICCFTALSLFTRCGSQDQSNPEQDSNLPDTAQESEAQRNKKRNAARDSKYVADEIASHYGKIQLAQLAAERSGHAEIRKVAELLAEEHADALVELQDIASRKSIIVPTEPDEAFSKQMKEIAEEKSEAEFNKAWCAVMTGKHEDAIKAYEDQLNSTQDEDLKNYIQEMLPHLRTHLKNISASCGD